MTVAAQVATKKAPVNRRSLSLHHLYINTHTRGQIDIGQGLDDFRRGVQNIYLPADRQVRLALLSQNEYTAGYDRTKIRSG